MGGYIILIGLELISIFLSEQNDL